MSVNLPTIMAQEFATILNLLSQQKGSRLQSTVSVGSHVGTGASPVDQIGAVEMIPATGRFQPMGRVDAATDRRWVYPADFELPQLIDSFDKLRMITDPTSAYVANALNAIGRKKDAVIIAALNGTAMTGVAGGTSTVLPSAQKVSVSFGGTNTGLTVAKLREARRLLMAANVDLAAEQAYCVVKAKQHDNLLAEAQVISRDYNDALVMKDGKIDRFLGFNFIHTELLESASTSDYIPVYVPSGIHLGLWGAIETDVDKRKDISSMPWQAYARMTLGATRLEEVKVVQISCYNA